ncbi:prepilin-type N-terminal cleavage/methylation domain-containing protein [Idiomarina aquatica]|uniref:Prepilin-type N-terminal cleavage/methylation domain-containing protein n=1 Tax=Idiomarina aquatica TaxID=1327752 RepID=A0A4R6PQG6_9GAMM|nr:type II secretion system protein [Idiomarina aquatica]TDP40234.1 prepilin-type N-terminal cleavage/methylation domain-containing protein [Idiomarina aquatica]
MRRRVAARGFTLIELLISLVILSSLVTLAGFAYTTYLDRWQENLGDFDSTLHDVRSRMLVNQALQSVYPFIVTSGENGAVAPFFFGEKNLVEGVVGTGIFNNANAGIFKLELKGDTLTYFERSTADVLLEQAQQEFTYDRQLRLISDVSEITYRYYGWPSYDDKLEFLSGNGSDSRRWFDRYLSSETGLLPEKIELNIRINESSPTRLIYNVANGADVIMGRYFNDEDEASGF